MEIQIDELVSTVHAVDSETVLAPAVLREIVRVVMTAVREDLAHDERTRAERRVATGRSPVGGR